MNDTFEKKIRAAAAAAWQVFLVAAGFLTAMWLAYLGMMQARPEWMRTLWGPDITWEFIQTVCLWVMVVLKFCIWLMGLAALWLTLWARRLRKLDRQ